MAVARDEAGAEDVATAVAVAVGVAVAGDNPARDNSAAGGEVHRPGSTWPWPEMELATKMWPWPWP